MPAAQQRRNGWHEVYSWWGGWCRVAARGATRRLAPLVAILPMLHTFPGGDKAGDEIPGEFPWTAGGRRL